MQRNHLRPFLLILAFLTSCVDPFPAPDLGRTVDFLVVDAFLNSTTGTMNVRLTRAIPLNSTEPYLTEENALVQLESETGASYTVPSAGQGNYTVSGLPIDPDQTYRLTIRTPNGREYASSFVDVLETPPIDSVTWREESDAMEVLANTHDDLNHTRYYQWRYVETWEYNAPRYSAYKFESGFIFPRQPEEFIYTCYSSENSTNILIRSSDRLSTNVIRDFRLTSIPAGSQKLNTKYSILVQQNSLSEEAYQFWSLLQQTTQNIGGLFDPQPGKVIGNLRSLTDPDEPVLGIFAAGSVSEQRIFVTYQELPPNLRIIDIPYQCLPDTLLIPNIPSFDPTTQLILDAVLQGGIFVIGYTFTSIPCADCRYQGGTLTKPDFWD